MSGQPTNTYSREHPGHTEPDRYLDDEGRCTFCGRADLQAQVERLTEARDALKRTRTNQEPWLAALGRFLYEYRIVRFPDDVLAWREERDEAREEVACQENALANLRKGIDGALEERDEAHRQLAAVVEEIRAAQSEIKNKWNNRYGPGQIRRAYDHLSAALADIPAAGEKIGEAARNWGRLTQLFPDTPLGEGINKMMTSYDTLKERAEKLAEWAPILEAAQCQDIKWKKPMPTHIGFGDNSVYVWALKAQEEMGELSAALLGGLIDKEGRGDALDECYQLIAVLLRIAAALREEEKCQE